MSMVKVGPGYWAPELTAELAQKQPGVKELLRAGISALHYMDRRARLDAYCLPKAVTAVVLHAGGVDPSAVAAAAGFEVPSRIYGFTDTYPSKNANSGDLEDISSRADHVFIDETLAQGLSPDAAIALRAKCPVDLFRVDSALGIVQIIPVIDGMEAAE
jgi:hypothetical protein